MSPVCSQACITRGGGLFVFAAGGLDAACAGNQPGFGGRGWWWRLAGITELEASTSHPCPNLSCEGEATRSPAPMHGLEKSGQGCATGICLAGCWPAAADAQWEGAGLAGKGRAEDDAAVPCGASHGVSGLLNAKPGKLGRSRHKLKRTSTAHSSSAPGRAWGCDLPVIPVGSSFFHVCGVGLVWFWFFFFPKGLEEELFGWAVSPLAILCLCCAGFATWPSRQRLDGELKQRKRLGAAKKDPPAPSMAQDSQEPAANHPLALKALSFL